MLKLKIILINLLIILPFFLFSQSISISADTNLVQNGHLFGFVVTAEGSFDSISEPAFGSFEVENRSQSQSSSINFINGKFDKKSSITYSYSLRPTKEGTFKIGPAALNLKNGKKILSNVVNITVVGSAPAQDPAQDAEEDEDIPGGNTQNAVTPKSGGTTLMAPLSKWEKQTPNNFIRTIVSPSENIYQGEPINVSYYLFVKPNTISNVNYYKDPVFENCWKEEKGETRLNFKRISIDGRVYDYALLKSYTLIPNEGATSLVASQVVMDVIIGSFFDQRKQTISSIALNIPLNELPEKELHKNGKVGDFKLSADKQSLDLDKDNLLNTVTFVLSGCGSFPSTEIKLEENPNLKIFAPEIDSQISATPKGLCGKKSWKFMVKGLKKGKTQIKTIPVDFYSKESGWKRLEPLEIPINVNDVSLVSGEDKEQQEHSFELLKELPKGVKSYKIKPLTQQKWFMVTLLVPLLSVLISFIVWLHGTLRQKRRGSFNSKVSMYVDRINSSKDSVELLNNFYDALSGLYKIELKGERASAIKQKYGSKVDEIVEFIRQIEHLTYSGQTSSDISDFKAKAVNFITLERKK